jgi:Protein of unknown function (DUF742)
VNAADGPGDGSGEDDAGSVRPYTVTGGRTRPSSPDLPVEALVEALGRPARSATAAAAPAERRRILELTSGQYLSVAEISAHLRLPVGVVRVLVGDLSDEGLVRVHGLTTTDAAGDAAAALSVLESVLDGLSAL